MSLFLSLFRLAPGGAVSLEDFHTEIAAHIMRSLPDETLNWLREIGATSMTGFDDFVVTTQEELSALEFHESGSRPDIAVRLAKNGERELIYIESKIGSVERRFSTARSIPRPPREKTGEAESACVHHARLRA